MSVVIPITLNLEESGAIALAEAAESLSGASDANAFLTALDRNHRLWRTLMAIAHRNGWNIIDRRTSEFVMSTLRKCGCGVIDSDVEALIAINRGVLQWLASSRDINRLRNRVRLAWRESGRSGTTPLDSWLIDQMERRIQH